MGHLNLNQSQWQFNALTQDLQYVSSAKFCTYNSNTCSKCSSSSIVAVVVVVAATNSRLPAPPLLQPSEE